MPTDAERLRLMELERERNKSFTALTQKESESGLEDFGEGLGVSALETYYGLKDLVTDLDDEDRATLKDWQDDAGESGWGTAGRIVGDIGQIVAGGGVVGGALKGASKLPMAAKGANALRNSVIAKDTIAAAGLGAAQLPESSETRAGNALKESIAALAGGGIAKGAGKVLRGVNVTPEAAKLLDEGVPLTPAQASANGLPRSIEYAMQGVPVLAKGRAVARENAIEQWGRQMMQKAAPKGAKITGVAREGAQQLKQLYDDAYTKVWKDATKPPPVYLKSMSRGVDDTMRYVGADGMAALRKAKADIAKLSADFNPKAVQSLDHSLKKQIRRASRAGDDALEEGLNSLRVKVRNILPKESQNTLKELDAQYGKYLVVKKAGAKAKSDKGVFTPKQFMDSVGQVGGETRTFVGKAPLQDFAEEALDTVGRSEPNFLLDMLKGTVGQIPAPQKLMDTGGRVVLGRSAGQKAVQGALETPTAKALRDLLPSTSAIGAGVVDY